MSKVSESQKTEIKEMIADRLGYHHSEEVTDFSKIRDDLGADSLDEVDLIMELEKMFDISITDEEAEKVVTVYDYYELIADKI